MKHVGEETLAYIEGWLPAADAARVESHLTECAPCRAEMQSLRETHAALAVVGREASRLPFAAAARGWEAVRRRWRPPVTDGLRRAAHRLSWQMAVSVAVAAMVFASGASLNTARASAPSVPAIQTPAAVGAAIGSDTPTMSATRSAALTGTPTQTLTPAPIETN